VVDHNTEFLLFVNSNRDRQILLVSEHDLKKEKWNGFILLLKYSLEKLFKVGEFFWEIVNQVERIKPKNELLIKD
jgi:hypothetical protein